MKRRFFLILTLFVAIAALYAQPPRFSFRRLGKEAGLDVRYNSFVYKDRQGFVWISSLQGLYRFDGMNLKHFLIRDETGRVVSDQNIQSNFWESDEGDLWFSTFNALHVFDRKKGGFRTYQLMDDRKTIDDGYHVFFLEPKSGRLWLKAGNFIWRYHIYTGAYQRLPYSTLSVRFAIDTTAQGQVRAILACPWFNGPGVEHFYQGSDGEWQMKDYREGDLGNLTVSFSLYEKENSAWLFSSDGLFHFNPSTGDLSGPYRPFPGQAFPCWSGAFFNREQHILLSSAKKGLWLFDTSAKEFAGNWLSNGQGPASPATDSPMEVYVDRQNQVWTAHHGVGLDYSSTLSNPFSDPTGNFSSKALSIKSLLEDPNRRIWALSGDHGVFVMAPSGTLERFIPFPGNGTEAFIQISIDSTGRIWGMSQNIIYQWRPEDGIWEETASLRKRLISMFHLPGGRKLVITNEGAFDLILNAEGFQFRLSEEFKSHRKYPFYHFLTVLQEKNLSVPATHTLSEPKTTSPLINSSTSPLNEDIPIIFIPIYNNNLWVTLAEKEKIIVIDSFDIGGDTYSAFQFFQADSIWVGTDRGLHLYHDNRLIPVLHDHWQKEGYGVYGVLGDRKRRLWFSTNQGLRLYDLKTGRITKFTQADGLAGNTFLPYAHLVASDGKFWFGTDNGLVVFHPDSVRLDTPAPGVHVEAVWVNNVPYEPGFVIGEADSLKLNYRQNTLDFKLTAIGYYQPENSTLKYRLAGYDDNWVAVPNGGFARFTKVPSGNYLLQVVAVNANGVEGKQKDLHIYIKPPFWETVWFKFLVVLGIVLLIAAIVGAYYRRKLQAQRLLLERQLALQEERDRIARELHDDLGGDLSNILYISDDLLFDIPAGEQKMQLERIAALAQGSIDSMREFIWVKDAGNNTLEALIGKLREFIQSYLSDKKIACRLEAPEAPVPVFELSSGKRRNIYLIVKEAIHNIIKHAQAKEVEVRIKVEGKNLCIEIQDNGRGFDPTQRAAQGHGLGNMQSRTDAIQGKLFIRSAPGQGTLLTLETPL